MNQTAPNNQSNPDDCLFCMEHLYETALGILEPEDRPRMEHHLADCNVCRSELHELDAAVNLLPLAVDQVQPRSSARGLLLARMQSEQDHPPAPPRATVRPHEASLPRPGTTRRPLWAMGSVFAAMSIALIALAAWNLLPIGTSDGSMPQGQIRVLAMESSSEGTGGHIGADPEEKDGMVIAWNLDPTQKHEVWCVNRDGVKTMVGKLDVAQSGSVMQTVSFPEAVGAYDQIYVARNDGTEELTVAPNKLRNSDIPSGTPPD